MRACSSILQSADLDRLLDQLCLGTTCLTVPLIDDVVQVGIGGDFATTRIAVSVTSTSVRVRRVDGRRLQVHIVQDWCGVTAPGVATPVFDEPADVVVLERCGGRWVVGAGLRVLRIADLDRFVGTLTRFALAKQRGAGRVDHTAGAA
ncbi:MULTISPECIES: hypothetical protein [unclassified Mycolicibacterium]|uniref:hypothetical protein n=1 Tax=unclassified Mycolicibacterium TaxID=2636767 RepID=UPI0012DEA31C|nr:MULTISPECIES: hypothetical protein [unclassified Mycolicibacterium]MUL83032.1 hypothetical protein [Mycolicibacterium sp. CBMA 329]MUL89367.1 hypothetical protein [Mycolicibacterium sp. CBMA 331]MUL99056.1 hypothetical protein [Mycolicibacterium sp. CBMA 334]MUM29976.1 hypothetical protein [Mycolicibacterium sp. CBMA 295]MUM38883.1 hypothetical protein [Mycolicibacterium sp. CBMA 247]